MEVNMVRGKFHGHRNTKFYRIWQNAKSRCEIKTHRDFHNYGGRGITFLDHWEDFINFKNDMYESYLDHVKIYGENNTTLDRIDNEKGYFLGNCRWATYSIQNYNRRNNKRFIAISPDGIKYEGLGYTKFALLHNLEPSNVNRCLNGKRKQTKGWTFKIKEENKIENMS
jgi:hypothetical protein